MMKPSHVVRLGLVLAASAAMTLAAAASEWTGGPVDASRVVAVGGSVTEIVFALGEEERLIARDSTSLFPEQALALPDVGYMRALSAEGVLSVGPTLIIALEGSGPPETVEVLVKASVPMVTVPERFDREGIVEKIRLVGEVLGVEDKAAKLSGTVETDLQAAEDATASVTERRKVLFILSMEGGRILASGSGTAADGIIAMAGARNAVTGYEGYKQLTDEAVIEAAPDVVLVMDRGGDHAAHTSDIVAHAAIASTPAGRDQAVIRMDGAYLLGFGPRTASAVRELSQAIYGNDAGD